MATSNNYVSSIQGKHSNNYISSIQGKHSIWKGFRHFIKEKLLIKIQLKYLNLWKN